MSAIHPHVYFNDGEGVHYEDIQEIGTYLYRQLLEAVSYLGGQELGKSLDMGYTTSQGMDAMNWDAKERQNLPEGKLFVPHPITGVVSVEKLAYPAVGTANDRASIINMGPGVIVQAQGASTVGTPPTGYTASTPIVYSMSVGTYDIANALVSSFGTLSTLSNGRYDLISVKLGFETGASESRDFKDASTDAITTVSVDKEFRSTIDIDYTVGAVDTLGYASGIPAPPSGYAPLISREREPDDDEAWFDFTYGGHGRFSYHAYPMRYAEEIVLPQDFIYSYPYYYYGSNALHPGASNNEGIVTKTGTLTGTDYVYAVPRNIAPHHRIIGVSVFLPAGGSAIHTAVDLGYWQWAYSGSDGFIANADLSSLGTINTNMVGAKVGWATISEAEWSEGAAVPYPVWGNGQSWGPLSNRGRKLQDNPVNDTLLEHHVVAVRISLTNSNYETGPVLFHYLY